MKRLDFCIVLCVIFVQNAFGLKINHLSVNRGLSQQDVETLIQDRYGFMWFGTYDGLNRYDGYRIETFRYDPDLSNTIADNRITALYESSDGKIWIGTEGSGLLFFNPATDEFGKVDHPVFKSGRCGSIFAFVEISRNRLLVGSTHGLFIIPDIFSKKTDVLPLNIQNGIVSRIRYLQVETDPIVWIGTETGAYRVQISPQNKLKVLFSDNSNRLINGVVKLSDNSYAIYGVGGIELYKHKFLINRLERTDDKILIGTTVLRIVKHEADWLIATTNNIFKWNEVNAPISFAPLNEDFFQNNTLQNILVGKGNNLWITSRNKGVAQIDLNPVKFYNYTLPAKDLFVKVMVVARNGKKFIGIKDYGLLIESAPGSNKFNWLFKGKTVASLMEDSQHNIWLFSDQLYMLSPNGQLTAVSTFKGYKFAFGYHLSCCEDNNGNVWVSTSRGLAKIEVKTRLIHYIPFPVNKFTSSENLSLNIYFDKFNNTIYCCTKEEGLYKYNISKNKLEQFTTESGLSSNHIWCLTIQNGSTIWVGTDVGVNQLVLKKDGVSIKSISDDSRIRNAKVMALCIDKFNNLWFTTSQGLFAFNVSTSQIMEFNYSDGLLSNTLSEVAIVDSSGLIWISSISGINYFDPQNLKPNLYEPNLVLRDFKVFNESIRPNMPFHGHVILKKSLLETSVITLKYDENNFQLEVAPIHYANPSKNKIAYRLSNIDKNWVETRNRIISYNNLPSGKYTLEIKGANCDGTWNKKALLLEIIVKPAPWASWWAYLIYIFIISTMAIVFYRYFIGKRKLSQQLQQKQQEHDNERQLNEAKLRFHTNITHEIRTPLALIVAPLYELLQIKIKDTQVQKHIQTIARNTDVLTRLVNQFLDFRKAVTTNYPLQISQQDLKQTIDKTVALFTEQAKMKLINYQYICDSEDFIAWYDEDKISKIVINLISNALKFTPQNGSIFILLEQSEDTAQITVEDTGCGIPEDDLINIFERYFQASNNSKGGTGIGLSLSKQLALIQHGDIVVKSQIGKGSTFIVSFPIIKDAYSDAELKEAQPNQLDMSISSLLPEVKELKKQTSETRNEKPIVLVIEDNMELADYMIDSLSKNYRIYHTTNGNQGLEMALIHTPNIILSDIMIEGMDGIQLTQTLKSDIRTNHIPIILISARSSEDEILEGLHTGAEDYLVKPFNPDVLKLKIKNLIRLSNTTKNKDAEGDKISQLCEREQKFINELRQIVLDEMISADFSVEFVCKKLGTNRMQLHRKMMSILGITASDFIKQIRFEQAKVLLETTDMNISETMYEVGLSSLYNFTQTFQQLFNESPSDIIKNRKRK